MFESTLLIFVVKLKERKREREILGKNSHDNSEFINFNIYFGIKKKKKKRIAQPISIVKNLFNKIVSPLLLHSLPFIISSFSFSFHKLLSTFFSPSSTSFSPLSLAQQLHDISLQRDLSRAKCAYHTLTCCRLSLCQNHGVFTSFLFF